MSNTSIARASVGRSIPSAPLRILDAPDLVDDYYLNLISWGHNNVSKKLRVETCGEGRQGRAEESRAVK